MLVTIPPADAANQEPTVRTVTSEANPQFLGFESVGVYGGHLLAIKAYQLIAIDLESGVRRLVHPTLHGDALKLAGDFARVAVDGRINDSKSVAALLRLNLFVDPDGSAIPT